MKTFYEWLNENGYDSWKLSTPPDWEGPDWSDNDLEWTDWEENSESVWLVNKQFIDARKRIMPWLSQFLEEVNKWNFQDLNVTPEKLDHSKSLSLNFNAEFGNYPATENPKTGEGHDSIPLRVNIKNPILTDGNNQIDLSGLEGKIVRHFYPNLR